MKRKLLYGISILLTALPWLFLFEVFPISYYRLSVALEVMIEGSMFLLLVAASILIKRDLNRQKKTADKRTGHKTAIRTAKTLFVLMILTLVVLGLVLLIIGISFRL